MTQDELLAKIVTRFPKIVKSALPVKDYLTVTLPEKGTLLPVAEWLKGQGFSYLEMATATDFLGPVNMGGFVRQQNFNPFLPDGATPEIESAANPAYTYRPLIELLYSFVSISDKARVMVKLEIPREGVSVPTLSGLFKTADWQERETFDLLGVKFDGHPNLRKILTPDFLQGHPLRKDYVHVKDRFDE